MWFFFSLSKEAIFFSSSKQHQRLDFCKRGYRYGRFERGIGSSGKVKIDFSVLLESVPIISFMEARREGDQNLDFFSSPETFREGSETFSLMVPKPYPKVSKPWAEFSVRIERFRNLDPRFRNLSRGSICKFQKYFQKSHFGPELAR
ncbi:hypothetical protein GQ457_06G013070 [Hibiscus cannabinus]